MGNGLVLLQLTECSGSGVQTVRLIDRLHLLLDMSSNQKRQDWFSLTMEIISLRAVETTPSSYGTPEISKPQSHRQSISTTTIQKQISCTHPTGSTSSQVNPVLPTKKVRF